MAIFISLAERKAYQKYLKRIFLFYKNVILGYALSVYFFSWIKALLTPYMINNYSFSFFSLESFYKNHTFFLNMPETRKKCMLVYFN